MNISVICSAAFGIFLILGIIGDKKHIFPLQLISFFLLLPCAVGGATSLLLSKMPDSFHIICLSVSAMGAASLQVLIGSIKFKKIFIVEIFLFVVSSLLWVSLFYPIFYMYKISTLQIIILPCIYLAIIIFCCVKFEIKSVQKIIALFLLSAIAFFLNFISISTLVFFRSVYSLFVVAGTVLLIAFVITSIITRLKSEIHESKMILNLLFVFSEVFIYVASVLLFLEP